MAYSSDPTSGYPTYPNPADIGSPPSGNDPNAGYTYNPPPLPTIPSWNANPIDVASGYKPSSDPNAGFVYGQQSGGPAYQPNPGNQGLGPNAAGNTGQNFGNQTSPLGPSAGAPDWSKLLSALGGDPQQYYDMMNGFLKWYEGTQYPDQLKLQQDAADLEKQIQTAAATGDWNGVATLQAKLQEAQIQLAQSQNNMQNALTTAGMTGQYGGAPTLQAQELMNQFGLTEGNQNLYARGQDVQMAGIQAQLAQSPLVAWYTARGLPPPQSAIMNSQIPDFKPYDLNWQFSQQGPAVAPLGPQPGQLQAPTDWAGSWNKELAAYQQSKAAGQPWTQQSWEGTLAQQGIPKQIADQIAQQNQAFIAQTGKNWDATQWQGVLGGDIAQYNQSQQYGGGFNSGGQNQPSPLGYGTPPSTPYGTPPPTPYGAPPQGPTFARGAVLGTNGAMPLPTSAQQSSLQSGMTGPAQPPGGAQQYSDGTGYGSMVQGGDGTGYGATPGMPPSPNNPTFYGGPVYTSGGPQPFNPTDPSMSQGPPPWASSLSGGYNLPSFTGMPGMPSTQQWAAMSPTEQQAVMQMNWSVNGLDPASFTAQMQAQAPVFGQSYGTYQAA